MDDTAMTIREMVMEIRDDVKILKSTFYGHLDEEERYRRELVDRMVSKEELELAERVRKATRRYIITSAIALTSVMVALMAIIIGTR